MGSIKRVTYRDVETGKGYADVYEITEYLDGRKKEELLLWDAKKGCEHEVKSASGGGIKCKNCSGWFCY